jgi:lysophospholipase L1-like esterase
MTDQQPTNARTKRHPALERASIALGAVAILAGVGCNAWTLPAFLQSSAPGLVVFAWIWDVAMLVLGVLMIRRKELFARVLLPAGTALLVFGTCFGIVDVYIGYRFLVTADEQVSIENVHIPDPLLGWRLKPGSTGTHRAAEYEVRYVMDERGLKAIPHAGEPQLDVIFFGDSYTFGYGVANDDTFANIIQARYVSSDVHLHNAGVMGYGLVQMYGRFLELEADIGQGDLVVLSPTSADIRRTMTDFVFPAQFIFRDKVLKVETYPYLDAKGGLKSTRLDTPYNRAKALLFYSKFTGRPFHLLYQRLIPDTTEEALTIVSAIRSRAERKGAQCVLIFLPATHECLKQAYDVDISRFDYIDIMAAFPDDEQGIAEIVLGESDKHWNRAGHEIAAQAIVEALVAQGKLDNDLLR